MSNYSNTKLITIFIVIFGYVITGLGTYFSVVYSLRNEDNLIKQDIRYLKEDITEIKTDIKVYEGLPEKVDNIEKTVNKSAETTEIIYLGLIAKGIIEPPVTR